MKENKNDIVYDVSIIGAGMGGLSAAGLLQKKQLKTILFESHYYVGGCAGYFKRREGFFDVGATTLSGFCDNRPLSKFINDMEINYQIYKEEIGIHAYHGDTELRYFSDKRELIEEVRLKFNYDSREFIEKITKIEKLLWNVLDEIQSFPKITLKDTLAVIKYAPQLLRHVSIFYKSFYDILPKDLKENEEFIVFLDQMLLISTQQKSKKCPAFVGIIGFLYPLDTYSSRGGMHGFCKAITDKIKEDGGNIHLKEQVQSVKKVNSLYHIQTNKGLYQSKKIVFNTPPSVSSKILNQDHEKNIIKKKELNKGHVWGAMTAYFSIKLSKNLRSRYHQVILDQEDKKIFETSSLFFSFSHPNEKDLIRVTVSTHIEKKLFHSKDDEYIYLKSRFKALVIICFDKYLKLETKQLKFDSVSTPLTWNHYTQRPRGEVGGLRHTSPLSLLRLLPNKVSKDVYYVGDYSFPGQGIVSVIQGSYNVKTIL